VKRTAVYPGTFDPVTNGHLDLADRGRRHFDRLIIGVLINEGKEPMFSVETVSASADSLPSESWILSLAEARGSLRRSERDGTMLSPPRKGSYFFFL